MIISYSDKPLVKGEKSIFLAGPTPRKESVNSWRKEALEILEKLKFEGIVYVPEYEHVGICEAYIDQFEWGKEGFACATIIAFWIPRKLPDMPAFTTNVEFGYWIKSGKILYGRPEGAESTDYLDWLYDVEYKKQPINNLRDLLVEAVEVVNKQVKYETKKYKL